ncbi:hypothetical protein HHI36_018866 [Cryptolaemus montrouzieri]|uniref:Anaphase-promoting complex subunit 4 n=1 Tax=Cryptolaemus montrouzieri TaxID=559131 RepID=A0ABD2P160_9CUCU
MLNTIKQLEERNVANEIVHMVWSDRMDLVAYSTVKGEVALHRLTWTRAWNIYPEEEHLTVKALSWRPDGKLLAIGYSNGEVSIVSIEDKVICKTIPTYEEITCIQWVQEKDGNRKRFAGNPAFSNEENEPQCMQDIDLSSIYLPEPPMLYFVETVHPAEEEQRPNILHEQSELNILLIGTRQGMIHISIFAAYPCVILNINEYLNKHCSIENILLIEDLSKIFVTVKDMKNNIQIVIIDSSVFKTNTNALFAVALKYVRIAYLMEIISNSIRNITETWESILLEMDNKLSKFASKCPQGGLTADFLDLLMFGIYSTNMEQFLLYDLTKKGLEKFGQSIEMSYTTIQELIVKYVTKYGQCITYHLAELRGMARFKHKFDAIGLVEDDISAAISSTGSFLIKAGEMHQIINHSIMNYKSFFRWLYTAIMHLLEEQIPSEIPKMTQQDLAYITEFFQNFDHIGNGSNKGFIMERLGQYLARKPLSIPAKMNENEWAAFISENELLKNDNIVLNHHTDLSLVQQFEKLKVDITKLFLAPARTTCKNLRSFKVLNFINSPDIVELSLMNLSKESVLFTSLQSKYSMILLEITIGNGINSRIGKFHFNCENGSDAQEISDIKFYTPSILSLLLQDHKAHTSIMYQFPITSALESLVEVDLSGRNLNLDTFESMNGSNFVPHVFKVVDMVVTQLAVSGTRKVGIVLSENKRKVKLFEMESEEEYDEDAEMTISPRTSDVNNVSMQES